MGVSAHFLIAVIAVHNHSQQQSDVGYLRQFSAYLTAPVSQTLRSAAGSSISLALKKCPLPPVSSIKGTTTSQKTPHGNTVPELIS